MRLPDWPDITRVTCCGTLVYRPGRNKIPRPRFEPRGSIFPEERISRCEMGLWDEGNPGLLSGRKKNKSRGGVPALGFNPHHLRRTEERKSAPEAPAWTPRWSENHVNQSVFWSGAEAETNELPKNIVYSEKRTGFIFYRYEKKEASHICLLQRNKLFIKRNCKVGCSGKT